MQLDIVLDMRHHVIMLSLNLFFGKYQLAHSQLLAYLALIVTWPLLSQPQTLPFVSIFCRTLRYSEKLGQKLTTSNFCMIEDLRSLQKQDFTHRPSISVMAYRWLVICIANRD